MRSGKREIEREREREKERERERETDRQTDRQTKRQTDRQTFLKIEKTRPDTLLPKSRVGGQGPFLRSLDH